MFKNTAGQEWVVFAFEDEGGTNPGEPVTADQAQITANVRIDGGAANAVDDTNPTVLEDGYYTFGITAAESNGDSIVITPVSSTANVNVIGVPGAVYTTTDLSSLIAAIDSDQVQNDDFVSNIHSRLVVMETAMDSDQLQTEASIDSDQLQNDSFVSDVHSRLVVMETANDSDQVIISDAILIIDTAIDSDQLQNDNFVSDVHSRLVVIEASIDSDQLQTEASIDSDQVQNDDFVSNIHSRLVVMETANDSDQVIISDAILVIDDLLDTEVPAITSNLLIIASDTVVIESQTTVMNSGLVTGACEGTPTTTVIQTNLAEITDDHYIGRIIVFTSGNALGEASNITDYAGGTGTVTVALMTTAPANLDTFTIY